MVLPQRYGDCHRVSRPLMRRRAIKRQKSSRAKSGTMTLAGIG
jgi:hypothetical protein